MVRHPGQDFVDFIAILALPLLVFGGADVLPSRSQCYGPFRHNIHTHAYHISSSSATTGITNKNAADTLGDIAFIFGSKGVPNPRGIEQYIDGIIEMVHVSVSSWGDYLQCNHASGSTVYSCMCPKDHKGPCDMSRPGKEQNSHSNGHVWYSFPHAGQGKYWDYEHFSETRGCRRLTFHARCIIDSLAYAGGCKSKCSAKNAKECVDCVNKLSDKEKEHAWDQAVFGGGCSDLNSPHDPLNRRRSKSRLQEEQPAPMPRRRRTTPTPPHVPPCLCLFDVDRTLTGKQDDTHHCPNNKVHPSIHDPAYGGGYLSLSQLALNLDKTFCVKCYVGIISHGTAGGDGSKMQQELVYTINTNKEHHLKVDNTWCKANPDDTVSAPLVTGVANGHKHHVASAIRDWYSKQKQIHIPATDTHFFDDEAAHVKEFQGFEYNARQISCNSRDNTHHDLVGFCGATTSECIPDKGLHLCLHDAVVV